MVYLYPQQCATSIPFLHNRMIGPRGRCASNSNLPRPCKIKLQARSISPILSPGFDKFCLICRSIFRALCRTLGFQLFCIFCAVLCNAGEYESGVRFISFVSLLPFGTALVPMLFRVGAFLRPKFFRISRIRFAICRSHSFAILFPCYRPFQRIISHEP